MQQTTQPDSADPNAARRICKFCSSCKAWVAGGQKVDAGKAATGHGKEEDEDDEEVEDDEVALHASVSVSKIKGPHTTVAGRLPLLNLLAKAVAVPAADLDFSALAIALHVTDNPASEKSEITCR